MSNRIKAAITALLSLVCIYSYGQRLTGDLSFDGLFDNREYKQDMQPQTIYGMRIMPRLGVQQDNHRFMVGVSKIWEFGSNDSIAPNLIMYYNYTGSKWSAWFGSIPRKSLQRQLPHAFLYDSIAFFDPTIKGTAFQYRGRYLDTELYCNWFSRQSQTRREAFRIVWDGYVGNSVLGAGWYTAMTHFAKPKESGHYIYEKFQLNPYLSMDLSDLNPSGIRLSANAGVLCSLIRCRKDGQWYTPTGFLGDVLIGWHRFDVKSTLYCGGSQQKYLNDPEAGLIFHRSDPFYNHSFYSRTDLSVVLIKDSMAEMVFTWGLNFTPDTPLHNRQMITLRYYLSTDRHSEFRP